MRIIRINYYFQRKEKFKKKNYNKRLDRIEELNEKIDYSNPKYIVKSSDEKFVTATGLVRDMIKTYNQMKNLFLIN